MSLIFCGKVPFSPLLFELPVLLVFRYRFLQPQQQILLLYLHMCVPVHLHATYMLIAMWFLSL